MTKRDIPEGWRNLDWTDLTELGVVSYFDGHGNLISRDDQPELEFENEDGTRCWRRQYAFPPKEEP